MAEEEPVGQDETFEGNRLYCPVSNQNRISAADEVARAELRLAVAEMVQRLEEERSHPSCYFGEAVFLARQRLSIRVPRWRALRGLPVHVPKGEDIHDVLREYGFVAENIEVSVNLRKLRFRLKYVYDFTFQEKPSEELIELTSQWDRAASPCGGA